MSTLIHFPEHEKLARAIASAIGWVARPLDLHRFPDGETLVTLPEFDTGSDLAGGEGVALLASLNQPDGRALALMFAAETARELGAPRVGLIAPYLAYMRQDKRFAPRQAISAPIFAAFLSRHFDWLATVDPHLHRIASLDEIFAIPARRVESAPVIARWIAQEVDRPVLIGPDSESRQWIARVAGLVGCPHQALEKTRKGDYEVELSIPDEALLRGRTPVILDDIASSGRTMIACVKRLRAAGAAPPVCVVIHAIFSGRAYEEILAAGAARVVSCDSVPHPSNAIDLAGAIAGHVLDLARVAAQKEVSR